MTEELKVIITAEVDKLKQEMKKGKDEVEDFGKKGKTSFADFNDAVQSVGDVSKKALAVTAGAIAGAATALLALGASTEEYRVAQAKLVTAFEDAGASADTAKQTYNELYRALGDTDKSVEAANHLAKLTTNQKDLQQWTKICQGVYATFGDSLPIEGLTEAANETARVGQVTGPLADALNWAGVNEDAFNEKLAKCVSTQEREALIRKTLSGLYDEAAEGYEENAKEIIAQNEAQAKLNETTAELGEAMAPLNTMLTEFGAEVLAELTPHIQAFAEEHGPAIKEALEEIATAIGNVLTWVIDNWDLVSTIGTVILVIAAALSVFSTAMSIVNFVMAASPVTWIVLGIVAALAALIAIIVLVIKHWDDIKAKTMEVVEAIKEKIEEFKNNIAEKFEAIKTKISETVENIKTAVTEKINAMKEKVQEIIEKLKEKIITPIVNAKDKVVKAIETLRSNFVSKIQAIKDKAADIFSTIKEKLTKPVEEAKEKIRNVVETIKGFFDFEFKTPKIKKPEFAVTPKGWKVGDLLEGKIPKLSIKWNAMGGVFDRPTIVPYGNTLQGLGEAGAEAIVPLEKNTEWLDKIADRLASKQPNTPVVLNVDGKTFAQTSINTINELTRQTGSLKLNIV